MEFIIPDGYRQVYGEILDENRKAKHTIMGFIRKMMEPHTKEEYRSKSCFG